ncbi:hypothetical protein WJX72_001051 [[Myrmecia] bisecta]|uniref:Uncharacterized protein n=1 Tax=[Myrmecia] bisecta TaxID=41462 RepID=A0AAW1PH62_9CHLO
MFLEPEIFVQQTSSLLVHILFHLGDEAEQRLQDLAERLIRTGQYIAETELRQQEIDKACEEALRALRSRLSGVKGIDEKYCSFISQEVVMKHWRGPDGVPLVERLDSLPFIKDIYLYAPGSSRGLVIIGQNLVGANVCLKACNDDDEQEDLVDIDTIWIEQYERQLPKVVGCVLLCILALYAVFTHRSQPFLDQTDLYAGDSADDVMLRCANSAPIGLAVYSKHFFCKEWPMRELRILVDREVLLPVLYGQLTHAEFIRHLQNSPLAKPSQREWDRFTEQVRRTTYIMSTDLSQSARRLREQLCWNVVRVLATKVAPTLRDSRNTYDFKARVKQAAKELTSELPTRRFGQLTYDQIIKAKEWV